MQSIRAHIFFVFVLAMVLSTAQFLSGCAVKEDEASDAGGDANSSPAPTGEGEATSEYFEVSVVTNSNYPTVITADGDGTTPCRVTASGLDLFCVIDMNELDMWGRGYQLNFTAPDTACEYLTFEPYYYNIAPVGDTPTAVVYGNDDDGLITSLDPDTIATCGDIASPANAAAAADIFYCIGGAWYKHEELFGIPAAKKSEAKCPWDYTKNKAGTKVGTKGKDCCTGAYTTYSENTVSSEIADPVSANWSGSIANCFDGPGMREANAKKDPDTGMPLINIYSVDDGGYSNIFKSQYAYRSGINVFSSNYYHRADHTPFLGGYPDTPTPTQWMDSANYRIDCLDANFEVLSRIRVVAREWNTNDEFLKFVDGATATPNEVGTETTPDQTAADASVSWSYPDGPNNDDDDWKDLDGLTPDVFTQFGIGRTADVGANSGESLVYESNFYVGFIDNLAATSGVFGNSP